MYSPLTSEITLVAWRVKGLVSSDLEKGKDRKKTVITINVNRKLVELVTLLSEQYSKSTGADPAEFYFDYYLNIRPHLNHLYTIGTALGFSKEQHILELGSGLGTKCILGSGVWQAHFTGLEPCLNTYTALREAIAEIKRINSHLPYEAIATAGEDTTLPSDSFDFVISSEVLEHVENPERVIQEIYRVLKPGGRWALSTCNYQSFYEGHYRCLWMPFLSKRSGKHWARMLGRNPAFVDEINFITRRNLVLYLERAGFSSIVQDPTYPAQRPPDISVEYPEGVICRKWGPTFLQRLVQEAPIHNMLRRFALEYKLYFLVQK